MGSGQWPMVSGGCDLRALKGRANVTIESYRDLEAWRIAMDLATAVYQLTRSFPREEMFGLTAQSRRAAASVAANIAEGWGRDNTGDYVRFLRIAQGSLKELDTHLLIAERVLEVPEGHAREALELADRAGRILRGLIRSLQRTANDQAER